MSTFEIFNDNCLTVMRGMAENSVDSIVTDPPYGLSFMGKAWDYDVPNTEIWKECLRVLKPGGHLLAFGGTRTYHRLVVNIEDAGFEIRDQIMWIYGSGFPKSMDISKAIDKEAGATREVIGKYTSPEGTSGNSPGGLFNGGGLTDITAPATDEAKRWSGYGTALKPANEPICLARKPLREKTVAKNVLKHGVGGLNVDASRIGIGAGAGYEVPSGRFPANILFDEYAAGALDEQTGQPTSRFFYIPKVSSKERAGSTHPTMKPIKLMEYLIKLVTPEGGIVLDPFMGSGTTGVAADDLGFGFVGCEMSQEYYEIAFQRLGFGVEQAN